MPKSALHLISASAGSGKTYHLVSEYLALALGGRGKVDAPFAYRNILAITFTNKAAGEMKARVFTFLQQLAGSAPQSQALSEALQTRCNLTAEELALRCQAMLRHMWHNYHDLSIRTIDSFMHTVVRGFAHDLDLDPEFEVVVDTRVEISACLDGFLADVVRSKRLTRMLSELSIRQIESEKQWDVQAVLEAFVQSHLLRDHTRDGLQAYANQTPEALHALRKASDQESKRITDQIRGNAQAVLDAFASVGLAKADLSGKRFPKALVDMAGLKAGGKVDVLLQADSPLAKRMRGESSWMTKTAPADKQAAFDQIEVRVDQLMQALVTGSRQDLEDYLILQSAAGQWLNLEFLTQFQQTWQTHLEGRNMLPVGDFQQKIAEVLHRDPSAFIYERIGQRYSHIMIDEFQDTSARQWGNFLPLVLQALSEGGSGLLVGDGKQSIYRWRGAEAGQFERLAHPESGEGLHANEQALAPFISPDSLDYNWRSAPEVVGFNNGLYSALGASQLGAEHVYREPTQIEKKSFAGYVHAQALAEKEAENNDNRLAFILDYLAELEKDKYPLEQCAILVRTGAQARRIGVFLREQGKKFTTRESLLVSAWPPAVLLMDALRWLHNPGDQEVAVRVLVSAQQSQKQDHGKSLVGLMKPSGRALEPDQAWASFFTKHLRETLPALPALEQLEALHQTLNGGVADPFVECVLEGARNLSERGKPAAAEVLTWWEEVKGNLSAATEAEKGAIQILTVHKSKGLEFEAVILPMWRRANPSKPLLWVDAPDSLNTDLPVLVPHSDVLSEVNEVAAEESKKQSLDDLNVLYVATTRAVRRLYLLVEANPKTKSPGFYEAVWAAINQMPGSLSDALWEAGMPVPFDEVVEEASDSWALKWPFRLDAQPQMAFMHPRFWDPAQESRTHGQNLHALLARVITAADCSGAVDSQIEEGLATTDDKDALMGALEELTTHPQASAWFAPGAKVFCERDILVPNANRPQVLRPDRVVVTAQEVLVVDYKSGQAKEQDKKQVLEYAHLLSTLYPSHNVQGYLLYTNGPDVLKVC